MFRTTDSMPFAQSQTTGPSKARCLEAALGYLRRGWSVILLHGITDDGNCTCGKSHCDSAGKHPIAAKWKHLQQRRMTEQEVRSAFAKHPGANIGIITGSISGGLCVVDIDGPQGLASLQAVGIDVNEMRGPTVHTGRPDGMHFYLNAGGTSVGNFAGKLQAIDGRADGGLVVAPPSKHASGRLYRFEPGTEELSPSLAPERVLRLFQKVKPRDCQLEDRVPSPALTPPPPSLVFSPGPLPIIGSRERTYAACALEGECEMVRNAPIGQQEATLNKAALKIGRLVGASALDAGTAIQALIGAGQGMANAQGRAAWTYQEIDRKVRKGVHDGERHAFDFSNVDWRGEKIDRNRKNPTARTDKSEDDQCGTGGFVGFGGQDQWAAPEKLPPLSGTVPILDPDLLPDALRPWLVDRAELLGVPLEFVAMPALAAYGATIGCKIGMLPTAKSDWVEYANLWAIIVGRPGSRKSSALKNALQPFKQLQKEADAKYKRELSDFEKANAINTTTLGELMGRAQGMGKRASRGQLSESEQAELELLKQQIGELKAVLEDAKPANPRLFWTTDATPERLGVRLSENVLGIAVVWDELSGWLETLQKQGREGERQLYLTAWNGNEEFRTDRIGRGETYVESATLTVIGGIQAGVLERLLVKGAMDGGGADGMIQRFQLLVHPAPVRERDAVDRDADDGAYEQAMSAFRFAAEFEPHRYMGQIDSQSAPKPGFRFTADAQEVFTHWCAENDRRISSVEMDKLPAFVSHLSKFSKLVAGLALMDHMCNLALDKPPAAPRFAPTYGTVERRSVERAIGVALFLEAHARKIYTAELEPQIGPAYALAEKIRAGSLYDGMTIRLIDRGGWAGLPSMRAVMDGLNLLRERGWLKIALDRPPTGRPSVVVRLNPQLDVDEILGKSAKT